MKKILLIAGAFLLCALTGYAQQANIYASGLSAGTVANAQVDISYFLNADATAVTVNFAGSDYQIAASVPVADAALLTKGAHTATISLATVPTGTYTWSVTATGAANAAEPVKISNDDSKFKFYMPMGLAVDNNFGSPCFGHIYVSEGMGSSIETATPDYFGDGRVTNDGIYVFDATLTALNTETYAGGVSWSQNNTFAEGGRSPGRLSIDAAGKVYIADNSMTNAGVYIMDPVNPTANFTSVFTGSLNEAGLASNHGRIPALYVEGSGESTVLYTIDRNYLPEGQNARTYLTSGMIFKYQNIATPITASPTLVYDNASNYLANDAMGLAADGRGGFWVSQNRSADAASIPSLSHVTAAGVVDYRSKDGTNVDLGNSARGVVALNADKTLLGVSSNKGINVYSIAYDAETGIPALTLVTTVTVGATNMDGVAFDVANNLYIVSASSERLCQYALPKAENTFTTPAPAASTITVEAVSQTPQANIYASELKMEKIDATHYAFTYTLNAHATSGSINFTSGGTTISQPAPDPAMLTKGKHTVTLDLGNLADGDYSWSVTATAAANDALVTVTDDADVNLKFGGTRCLALDNSFESPAFGRLYVGVANPSNETTVGRALTKGVYILDAALSDVTNQGNTGWNGAGFTGTSQSAPIKAWAASDGRVYFSDWTDGHPGAFVMSPTDPTDFVSVFGGTVGANGVTTNAGGDFIHGSYGHNIVVLGEGENTKIYSIDEDYPGGANSFLVHNIGTAGYPYTGTPTVFSETKFGNYGTILPDGHDGFWVVQSRGINYDDAANPALRHFKADGVCDYQSNGALGALQGGAAAISYDGQYLVAGGTKTGNEDTKQISIYEPVFDTNGNFTALGDPILNIPVWNTETSGVGIDVAWNVYALTGTNTSGVDKRLSIYALPKADNSFTTPAPASQKIQIGGTGIVTPKLDNSIRIISENGQIRLLTNGVKVKAYTLYNVSGSALSGKKAAAGEVIIPTGNLSAGVYLLQVVTDEGTVVKRFIK